MRALCYLCDHTVDCGAWIEPAMGGIPATRRMIGESCCSWLAKIRGYRREVAAPPADAGAGIHEPSGGEKE